MFPIEPGSPWWWRVALMTLLGVYFVGLLGFMVTLGWIGVKLLMLLF